ncbi:hypothetical protein M8R19_08105 [Pseudomonas sp. R3.Fl]|uniref:serine O-acetyltransferase n=1 Tax=Pseudomonas sp. R3.Fl TaxID=2928708 RepID=UPI00201D7531|nr:hypothetical protein [Pseudomonas sp. R3.Fl]MCL6688671.1 hypothetical protein [Pseudomonas sp. R3.Fl]
MKAHSLTRLLAEDIKTILFYKKRSKKLIPIFSSMLSPSFICTTLHRISHRLYLFKIPVLPRLIWWLNFLLFKVDIDQRCKLYGGLYLPHPMGIVIGEHVSLRGYAKIMQGVTIGGNLGKTSCKGERIQYQPLMDGRIFIGPNSILAGPITLSGNIFVSASAIASQDASNSFIYSSNKSRKLDEEHETELYTS